MSLIDWDYYSRIFPQIDRSIECFFSNRPLENDISTWNYELVATDSEGANVSDNLDIHVQQHKLSRSVNHEFNIYLRIDKRNEFPTDVDWELKVRLIKKCFCPMLLLF